MISLAEHNSEAIIRYLIFEFLVKSAFQDGIVEWEEGALTCRAELYSAF